MLAVAADAGTVVTTETYPAASASIAPAVTGLRKMARHLMLTYLRTSQFGLKSWLLPAAFLHGHWSSCWPRLAPAPKTSRHRPLAEFLNSQEPSDCRTGSHWALADELAGSW